LTTDDDARGRRRKEASSALTWMWSRLRGELRSTVTAAHYEWVYSCCCSHLTARFAGRLHDAAVETIVGISLIGYLPLCHISHLTQLDPPGPEDILRHMDDASLDWLTDQEAASVLGQPRVVADDNVVESLFGKEFNASSYREALHLVHLEGERAEFLVVTQFMDLWQASEGSVREEEVAARLEMDVADIRPLLFRFARRMSGGRSDG
jgi:hypothetical protein